MSNARFSIIPAWIVTDNRLKGSDLKVLCLLGTYTNKEGWCRRSQVKMAEQLNCGRSTVQDSLNRLSEIGAVEKRRVDSADGRDSAHWYRVILDRVTASNAFAAYDDEDEQEFGPISGAKITAPPAGIPAPPAGLGAAPPAGSGPAPINERSLTIPSNGEERERGSDDGEESLKALERRFRKWWSTWPTYATDTEATTRRAWLDLTAEQRKACEARTADYLAAAKASGRKFSKSGSTYLSERAWERLSDKPAAAAQAMETYSAYSRAWSALRLAELSRPVLPLRLTPLEESILESKPEKADMIWRDKREKGGWPGAVKLHEAALNRRRVTVPEPIVALSQSFDKVHVGGPVWDAWQRLHFDNFWPWLPKPEGLDWVQFPALPDGIEDLGQAVREAMRDFQRKLIGVRGNDDAA